MPVTKGKYEYVETQAYIYLTQTAGFNTAIACGILANIERESNFNPTATNSSSGAYGLCQWLGARQTNLKKRANYNSASVQLQFMYYELNSTETSTLKQISNISDNADGAYTAGSKFSKLFERHGNSSEDANRGTIARDKYYKYYSGDPTSKTEVTTKAILNRGQDIVRIAREQLNKSYKSGRSGPNEFDSVGLVYYSYNTSHGYGYFKIQSATSFYEQCSCESKVVSAKDAAAGDLLFYKDTTNSDIIEYVAIANGSGGRIYASKEDGKVVEEDSMKNPTYILRTLADSETSQGVVPYDGASTTSSPVVSTLSNYDTIIQNNLTSARAGGYEYGYLHDMNRGESFKFYIPEFSEQAGANWTTIDIVGRSVQLVAYNNTTSRKINISLDLYAGAGLYVSEDPVSKLHRDANFLKSLEYPDYANGLVSTPPTVHLILGSAISIVGIVNGVNVQHMRPLDSSGRSMYLKVSFTVTQTAADPPDIRDIRDAEVNIPSQSTMFSNTSANVNTLLSQAES